MNQSNKLFKFVILGSPLYTILFFAILLQGGNLDNWRYLMVAIIISALIATFSWLFYPKSKKSKRLHSLLKFILMFTYGLIFLRSTQVYYAGVKVATGSCILKNAVRHHELLVSDNTGIHKAYLRYNVFSELKGKSVGDSTYICNREVTIHYLSNSAMLDLK